MPCPLPLAPRKTHRAQAKQPVPSFSRIAPALGRGFIPSEEGSPQFPTTCAASSAQHPIACRNRGAQWHLVPLAPGQRFFSLRLHRATRLEDRFEFTTTCAASPALNALRARARRLTRSTRAAVQLATACLS